MTRREFLARTGQVGTVIALSSIAMNETVPAQEIPGKQDMIAHTATPGGPYNLETKLPYLRSFFTPNQNFFVRMHYPLPKPEQLDPANWRLSIEGEVENPYTVSFAELTKNFEQVTLITWLQCFGNGRSFFVPRPSGNPWKYGAIGQAIWKGVRVRDLLLKATLKIGAKHVASQGYDDPPQGAEPFIRSIPLEKALDPNTLIVYEMNGEPLPLLNGYPVRLLVPGWGGSASVKWLKRMIVTKEEWPGRFMQQAYRIPAAPVPPGAQIDPKDMITATRQPVNSFFTSHAGGETIQAGEILLTGIAYSGETGIAQVEVSTDGGQMWRPAQIVRPDASVPIQQRAWMWYHWEFRWQASAGTHTLLCRATDWLGRTQPADQRDVPWNPLGYNYNAIQRITVTVT
ncbi:MAG: sulfite oxidase [Candidatus Bipolaricaulota bacterium]|nr:sulfite oxidase [Candidatus Bipolaricaulota bacterium]